MAVRSVEAYTWPSHNYGQAGRGPRAKLLAREGVCAIPEAGTVKHVRQNRAALNLQLRETDMVKLDEVFPLLARLSRWPCSRHGRHSRVSYSSCRRIHICKTPSSSRPFRGPVEDRV